MKTSPFKNSITYLFLVLFLSMKLIGLHTLSHSDDKDHSLDCTICDHIISHNLTPVITTDIDDYEIENVEFVVQKEINNNYCFIASSSIESDQLFSRPPPQFI
ncbi:hypothetical protein EGM88_01455 [Aureibaculum marinum]|uniref:Uncharacterized protein n=1 Tax=Aureibaculum marinum TaxID=2487930 RepID=A0A3N4P0I4_9FLAO|nr:hypothetical protein [Aureibaculum marinum]RPD99958.1 hypothetical protein EGM88_01455 [Aureibaculum marinum]